jgi:hypothetical protein
MIVEIVQVVGRIGGRKVGMRKVLLVRLLASELEGADAALGCLILPFVIILASFKR